MESGRFGRRSSSVRVSLTSKGSEKCKGVQMPPNASPSSPKACMGEAKSGIRYGIAWIAYVLLGSWIFLVLEQMQSPTVTEIQSWTRFKELLSAGEVVDELEDVRRDLQKLCPKRILQKGFSSIIKNNNDNNISNQQNFITIEPSKAASWVSSIEEVCGEKMVVVFPPAEVDLNMVDAIYYTMTLVTTIGFGHISPTTKYGQMFCVLFALVGVPLTCILMAKNSNMLSNRMLDLYKRSKKRYRGNAKTLLYGVTWLYLSVGFIVFMFVPSVGLSYLEDWTYWQALYFTFITLSTIGFGDLVAGYGQPIAYNDLYKMCIVVWIMLALGYWVLLLNFLQKAIQSNVPRKLKKTFKGKNIAKQAEVLRQLMAKVKPSQRYLLFGPKVKQSSDGMGYSPEERLHVMALMVETMMAKRQSFASVRRSSGNLYSPYDLSGFNLRKNSTCETKVPSPDPLHLMALMVERMSAHQDRDEFRPSFNRGAKKPKDKPVVLQAVPEESSHHVSEDQCKKQDAKVSEEEKVKCEPKVYLPGSDDEDDEMLSTDDMKDDICVPDDSPPTFADLMEATVVLRSEKLQGFKELVEGKGKVKEGEEKDDEKEELIKDDTNCDNETEENLQEISLPLRDVIGLVLLVASLEEDKDHLELDEELDEEEEEEDDEDVSSSFSLSEEDSTAPVGNVLDPKEAVPLLRSVFLQSCSKSNAVGGSMAKEALHNAIFKSVLEHCLSDRYSTTEGEGEDSAAKGVASRSCGNIAIMV